MHARSRGSSLRPGARRFRARLGSAANAAPPAASEPGGPTGDTPNGVALLAFLSLKGSVGSLRSDGFSEAKGNTLGFGLEGRYVYRAPLLQVGCGASYDYLLRDTNGSTVAHQIRLPIHAALVAPITGRVDVAVGGQLGPTFLFLPNQDVGTLHAAGGFLGPTLGVRADVGGHVDLLLEGRYLLAYAPLLNGDGYSSGVDVFVGVPAVGIGAQHRF
ncbi:MAG: hypothetical protein WKG00_20335 [Polyangiaceae bacterium]